MGDVTKLRGESPLYGMEATTRVVAWLREQADFLERGEARPAHKAVLTMYEDTGGKIRTVTVFCNTSSIERAGIMSMALHDTLESD